MLHRKYLLYNIREGISFGRFTIFLYHFFVVAYFASSYYRPFHNSLPKWALLLRRKMNKLQKNFTIKNSENIILSGNIRLAWKKCMCSLSCRTTKRDRGYKPMHQFSPYSNTVNYSQEQVYSKKHLLLEGGGAGGLYLNSWTSKKYLLCVCHHLH